MFTACLISVGLWLLIITLSTGRSPCKNWGVRGGSDDAPQSEEVDPVSSAQSTLAAQQASNPGAAQLSYDILSNPNYGLMATSQLYKSVFDAINPEASAANKALFANLISGLNSPTNITPEQQAAKDATQNKAQGNLVKALNTQSNLGGGLFGGQAFDKVSNSVGDLQNAFATEDINFYQNAGIQNKQLLLSLLGLTPQPGIQAPQYQSPAASGDNVYQGQLSQANLNAQLQAQQQANQSALYQSLFGALGQAGAAALTGGTSLAFTGAPGVSDTYGQIPFQ